MRVFAALSQILFWAALMAAFLYNGAIFKKLQAMPDVTYVRGFPIYTEAIQWGVACIIVMLVIHLLSMNKKF